MRDVAWDDADAVALRKAMGAEMTERYADLIAAASERQSEALAVVEVLATAVAYTGDGVPVGHAALRRHRGDLELKRMYVAPEHRGTGVANALLDWVERTARAHGAARVILHTGERQPDAIRLYEREGWTPIPIFPPYDRIALSVCMEKRL
ncbi:GNAT family N-acetyltransferase [Actinocorallia lasiicapitis]